MGSLESAFATLSAVTAVTRFARLVGGSIDVEPRKMRLMDEILPSDSSITSKWNHVSELREGSVKIRSN